MLITKRRGGVARPVVSTRIEGSTRCPRVQQPAVSQRGAACRAEGGVPPLTRTAAAPYLAEIGSAWSLADDGTAITRSVTFGSFGQAMRFINALADLAEDEGHHPDFCVSYKRVDLSVSTHAIGGLSESDFILAAKTNQLLNDLHE